MKKRSKLIELRLKRGLTQVNAAKKLEFLVLSWH